MIKVKNTETIGDKKVASGKLVLLSAEFDPKEIFPSGNFWKYLIELGGETFFPVIISETEDILFNPETGEVDWYYDSGLKVVHKCSGKDTNDLKGRIFFKVLAMPENFSPELIKKIADEKLKDGEEVFVECDDKSEIKLDKNHINLIKAPKKPKPNAELKQIAIDLFDGKIFSDRHIHNQDSHSIGMVFMPLILGAFSESTKEEIADINFIYEYLDQAGPAGINGMPCFFSFRYLTKAEAEIMFGYYDEYKKVKEDFAKI